VPLDKLLEAVALGARDDDTLASLANRLALMEKRLKPTDREELGMILTPAPAGPSIPTSPPAAPLRDLAKALLDATDPDAVAAVTGGPEPNARQLAAARETLFELATRPFDNHLLRQKIISIQKRDEQVLDTVSVDRVREASFSAEATDKAKATVESFKQYIQEHRDEIAALQLIFNTPPKGNLQGRPTPTFEQIRSLAEQLSLPPHNWTTETLWRAYAQLEKDRVHGLNGKRVLTDVISLVRHAVQLEDELVPYPDRVRSRYEAWLQAQEATGKAFTPDQRWWLDKIAEHVGVNLTITPADFDYGDFFNKGGAYKAMQVFGTEWPGVLTELNTSLVD
jgi:type I restriction enzyme R subunit